MGTQQRFSHERLEAMYAQIHRGGSKFVAADGTVHDLPGVLGEFLETVTANLNSRKPVSLVHPDAALTTFEAARTIGVSRAYLLKVLDAGEIPFHRVGTHRRVYMQDLLAYKANRDRNRREVLENLVQAEVEEGLYDRVPMDFKRLE